MWPILLCSIFAVSIVIEKLMYFAAITTDTQQLKQTLFDLVKANNIKEAIALCESNHSPLAKILKSGIVKFGSSREEIKESMEEVSLFEIPKLEKKLSALATIAHMSPLLGLLGTVTGIAGSFYSIQIQSNAMNPLTLAGLAGGVWEALITTAAGLLVAIPAFVSYNYLVNRVNTFVLEMERGATELVNLLSQISEMKGTKRGGLKVEV